MKLSIRAAAAAIAVLACVVEAGPRVAGMTDFPVYRADATIGYLPAPSQTGAFLRTNDWAFNSHSMGVAEEFAPGPQRDVVLIGDSVVFGGNPYRQAEKLGPQLQERLGQPVWPVGAGSWALRNALTYLKLNPDVVAGADAFVFVLNSGDFAQASSWPCDRTHPRARPAIASIYLLERYALRAGDCEAIPAGMQVPPGDWREEFKAFVASAPGKPIRVFLYPELSEQDQRQFSRLNEHGRTLVALGGESVKAYSVGEDSRWTLAHYRDGIHPTPLGYEALAAIIARPDVGTEVGGAPAP